METSHRRDTSEGDENNLSLVQSGRLDVGPDVPRYEEDLPRSGGATDYVRMLCVVERELENAKHAVHQQDTSKLAKPASKGGQINLRCLQSHVNPSLGH